MHSAKNPAASLPSPPAREIRPDLSSDVDLRTHTRRRARAISRRRPFFPRGRSRRYIFCFVIRIFSSGSAARWPRPPQLTGRTGSAASAPRPGGVPRVYPARVTPSAAPFPGAFPEAPLLALPLVALPFCARAHGKLASPEFPGRFRARTPRQISPYLRMASRGGAAAPIMGLPVLKARRRKIHSGRFKAERRVFYASGRIASVAR